MDNQEFLTVSEVNKYIKTYLENNYFLREIFVKGEVSNFKRHQSGTLYFSIKDATSRINVVMFNSYANQIVTELKDGALVLIKGRLSVYEAGGTYQIQAYQVLFDSIGLLYQKYELLKKKLEAEGLFDIQHKKPLPLFPKTIGIITAPYGAAIHDMMQTIQRRWPLARIILFPSLVQGNKAAEDIAKQIAIADHYGVDVIICGRGGGSIEDLWPFNEEIVARAIYACQTPIISAVGHQSDFTIADFVADKRGLTPTDGAMQATPKLEDVYNYFIQLKKQMFTGIQTILSIKKEKLLRQKNAYIFMHPEKIYETYRMHLDLLENQLQQSSLQMITNEKKEILHYREQIQIRFESYIKQQRLAFISKVQQLDTLSPLKILNRGYGILFQNHRHLRFAKQLHPQDQFEVRLQDGKIQAKVEKVEVFENGRKNDF